MPKIYILPHNESDTINTEKPVILVTNDDGITAPGIAALVKAMKTIGEVVVVAPDSPQSGMGHAITVSEPLRLDEVRLFGGIRCFQASGTPADCVKLAVARVLHRKPDLVVSGINHGSNASINVIYSGTMSAAVEGAIEGIQAIGFSFMNYSHQADMESCIKIATKLARKLLADPLPHGTLLNVNIPDVEYHKLKGYRVCRQAVAKYEEKFDERTDPNGRKYYWLTGDFINHDNGDDTDVWALANHYVSIVPVQFDLTAHYAIANLKTWEGDV